MKPIAVSLAVALAAATLAPAAAQPAAPATAQQAQRAPRPDPAAARARVLAKWEEIKADGFSGAVRIDLGGETLIAAGAGFADPVARRPWTAETQFEIGSLTKPMTAAAILKLQDLGKLTVNDPLSRFFPEAPAALGAITLHQLMTHTSGLPVFAAGHGTDPDREPLDRAAFLARLWTTPLKFEPGKDFFYSNLGYSVLAAVVEKVSGEDYEVFLRREVLAPGGARTTGYRSVFDAANSARTPDGRDISVCCWGPGPLSWNLVGNGGIVSNLADFVSWRKAFAEGRVVSPAAVRAAATSHWPNAEGDGGEGYGWIVGQFPTRGQVEMAAGGNPYFTTEMRHYPEYGLTTLITTNDKSRRPGDVVGRLVRAAFGEPDLPPPARDSGNPAETALLDAFAAALAQSDPAAQRAFLEANLGPMFLNRHGIERIAERFAALSRELAGARVVRRDNDGQGEARLTFGLPGGGAREVAVEFGGTPQAPKLAGFDGLGA